MDARIAKRARRWLGTKPFYIDLPAKSADADKLVSELSVVDGEEVIGLYSSDPQRRAGAIVITNQALHLGKHIGWDRISFDEIKDASVTRLRGKGAADSVRLRLRSGRIVHLPVTGGRGRFRDAWSFLSFLIGVLADD